VKGLLHPAADEEFAASVQYYHDIEPDLGIRFYREIERLIANVCNHPERYCEFDPPARRHLSFEFPYALVYITKPEHVWIVAVMHMKRDPGYWRERLS
jgi:plasmid stabilization system protein ParE